MRRQAIWMAACLWAAAMASGAAAQDNAAAKLAEFGKKAAVVKTVHFLGILDPRKPWKLPCPGKD